MQLRPFTLCFGFLLALLVAVAAAAGGVPVEEAALAPTGKVYEANAGPQGRIYLSDSGAREVWRVDAGGAYTVFDNPYPVLDARPDGDGGIWWTDGASYFGRVDSDTSAVTTWEVDPYHNLGGLDIDDEGSVWLTQAFGPSLFRYTPGPAAGQLCTYTLPSGGDSEYVLYLNGYVWLASWGERRLFRLDPAATTNQLTYWQIPDDASWPRGTALDPQGNLWWADFGLAALGRLEPALDRMTVYSLPLGTEPQMVGTHDSGVWYTEFSTGSAGRVGHLDPDVAQGRVEFLERRIDSIAPECQELVPVTSGTAITRSGQLAWTAGTIEPVLDTGGWTIYELGAGYQPYGIAQSGDHVWVAEQGSQKLLRLVSPFDQNYRVFLPLVVRE